MRDARGVHADVAHGPAQHLARARRQGERPDLDGAGREDLHDQPVGHVSQVPHGQGGVLRPLPRLRRRDPLLLGVPRGPGGDRQEPAMSISRRGFLGAAGLSALALASKPALEAMGFEPVPQEPTSATAGTRWAMVVDPRKCLDQGDCTKCIDVCDHAHNIPRFTDPAHEVKWIWKEPFEDAFPFLELEHAPDDLRDQPVMVLCNHCDEPAVRAGVPDAGDVEAQRRHRDDGLAPLHRLPLLHGGVSVRLAQLQLERPAPGDRQPEPGLSDADQGRGGEVHVLRGAARQGRAARVRRGLHGQGARVRQPGRPRERGPHAAARALRRPAQGRAGHASGDLLRGLRGTPCSCSRRQSWAGGATGRGSVACWS